jgi:hypothetical protein
VCVAVVGVGAVLETGVEAMRPVLETDVEALDIVAEAVGPV